MASRVSIYGKAGDPNTEKLRREMRSMSMTYNFYDVGKNQTAVKRLEQLGTDAQVLPKVEVVCANNPGSVILTNPDVATFRQTLYAEDVLGITSYWI